MSRIINDEISDLLGDRHLVRLLAGQLQEVGSLDVTLARRVKELLPGDHFSISQYLFGLSYFRERLAAIFPGGRAFLDVGCGAGNWSIAAGGLFERIVGIDVTASRIEAARTIAGASLAEPERVQFLCQSVESLPFADESFDHCLCFNVLAFLPMSRVAVLSEMRRVVRRGGRLYLAAHDLGVLPYLASCSPRAALRVAGSQVPRPFGHGAQPMSRLSQRYVDAQARRAGWRLITSGPEGSIAQTRQPSIFPRRYFGLPVMREYIFEAA